MVHKYIAEVQQYKKKNERHASTLKSKNRKSTQAATGEGDAAT